MKTQTPNRPGYADPEVLHCAARLLAPEVAGALDVPLDDELIEDLAKAWDQEGYQFARRLERTTGITPDADLVETLDASSLHRWTAHRMYCAAWVRDDQITTNLEVGDKVRVLDHELGLDSHPRFESHWIGEVTSIDQIHAEATVYLPAVGHVRSGLGSHGRILPWEQLQRLEKPVLAFNLATSAELFFSGDVSPKWAAAYGYCEESDRLSWLFSKREAGEIDSALAELPIQVGERSVNCGDWAAMVESA